MKPEIFGRISWAALHCLCLIFDRGDRKHAQSMMTFLYLFPRLVQCVVCRYPATEFDLYLDGSPATERITHVTASLPGVTRLSVADAVRTGMTFDRSVALHNLVNRKISLKSGTVNPQVWDLRDARQHWTIFAEDLPSAHREFWSYVCIVASHYDKHGRADKMDLYAKFLQALPGLVAIMHPDMCDDVIQSVVQSLTAATQTSSRSILRVVSQIASHLGTLGVDGVDAVTSHIENTCSRLEANDRAARLALTKKK